MPAKREPVRAIEAMRDQRPRTLAELNALIDRAGPLVPGARRRCSARGRARPGSRSSASSRATGRDRQGRPFVGPAGQLFSKALAEVGIDRHKAYLTNAVKHFKFEQRGQRRIHAKPTAGEVKHYRLKP